MNPIAEADLNNPEDPEAEDNNILETEAIGEEL